MQKKDGDLASAYALIREIITFFASVRADAFEYFHAVFTIAKDLLVEVDSAYDDIPLPRICARQTQGANVPAEMA